MPLSNHFALTLLLAGSSPLVRANTPDLRIPDTWLETPMTRIPHHMPLRGWTGALNMAREGFLLLGASRVYLEIPPGETLRAELRSTWDSSAVIAMESDAWWKFGLSFSKRSQRFKNREQAPKFAWVGLAAPAPQGTAPIWVEGRSRSYSGYSGVADTTGTGTGWGGPPSFIPGSGNPIEPVANRPWRMTFTRSWDIAAWRAARLRSAPDPATLPERMPSTLQPNFVPYGPYGEGVEGVAEVTLILDSEGRPWAVHPMGGHPKLLSGLTEWAWCLNFEAPKDLGSAKAVKVPLRVTFHSQPAAVLR